LIATPYSPCGVGPIHYPSHISKILIEFYPSMRPSRADARTR